MKATLVLLLAFVALVALATGASAYNQVAQYTASNFFDHFQFFSGNDPTNGYVDYTTRDQATQWELINTNNNKVFMGCDTTTVSSGRGRAAVRISSNASYNLGLFVLDLDHMPTGCGTWPAFWLVGPNWPSGGEIDIIEGVNTNSQDQTTLHTDAGCTMDGQDPTAFDGHWANQDCEGNTGCGIIENGSDYGANLNNEGGGVYAMQWTDTVIQTWYFNHNNVPGDLSSGNPNPDNWGRPYAKFLLGGNCPSSHFHDHNIIINLTFCGDWAGSVFSSQCGGDCNSYVQNNPSAFTEAYWSINSLTVYQ